MVHFVQDPLASFYDLNHGCQAAFNVPFLYNRVGMHLHPCIMLSYVSCMEWMRRRGLWALQGGWRPKCL